MSFGEKLSKLRRENNYTQEQLAEILGVSRQAISKWESDTAYPETEKIIKICDLFDCSMDYLLRDKGIEINNTNKDNENNDIPFINKIFKERKSEKVLWGMPLYHIGKNARGIVAIGLNARGIVAIGLKTKGIVSFGLLSLGLFSCGMFSIGLFAFGLLTLGILSLGCFSFGVFALGAISFGIISIGAVAIGEFSVGALAIGKYVAIGDVARGMIALGETQAVGTIYQVTGRLSTSEISKIVNIIDETIPSYFIWARELIKIFIH